MLREPGTNFPEGVENDLRSTENSQNESHLQDHLDERMTPHLSIQDNIPSKTLREPGANFLGGVENDLRSTENSQNESHLQDHLSPVMICLRP